MTDDTPSPSSAREAASVDEQPIDPASPEEFGLVQAFWGDGKGKTTAAMGMGFRAAGHGYRVHMLQFMKGGAGSVEDVRGEYNAIEAFPRFSYENSGHYGWHGFHDGSDDDEHAARAEGGVARLRDLLADPQIDGERVHMLIVDEILYAANRGLVDPETVVDLIGSKPDDLELVLTGGHDRPDYAADRADLVTEVRKETHPIDDGQGARKGTEY
ncbi:cob(I)yrinic acid a,c-diamide adenosyltransferase [Halostella sp. PRR32]|uniref:cob(I)yrinic acid a,c-diamide adenosyltransferase n=1 Tax=Halostella sp. PRR32 TaxID=3098147 RepID=UPI00110F0945|nr:cob(I)yrinic acid a,c-diamide adenosyltransferase [Halostella sp. PRR32]